MHYNDTSLPFLRKKIQEIKCALFKSEIDSVLSLPTNIINTLQTDDEGNVYFFTSCNSSYADQIELPFYAYLDYHKKGFETLRISGKAGIVKDAAIFSNYADMVAFNEPTYVLIKMKIMQAEYFGQPSQHSISWTKKIRSTINHIFSASHQNHNFS